MLYMQYYKDERDKEIVRAATEKQCILASKNETDERVKAMPCKIAALKVIYCFEGYQCLWMSYLDIKLTMTHHSSSTRSVLKCEMEKSNALRLNLYLTR